MAFANPEIRLNRFRTVSMGISGHVRFVLYVGRVPPRCETRTIFVHKLPSRNTTYREVCRFNKWPEANCFMLDKADASAAVMHRSRKVTRSKFIRFNGLHSLCAKWGKGGKRWWEPAERVSGEVMAFWFDSVTYVLDVLENIELERRGPFFQKAWLSLEQNSFVWILDGWSLNFKDFVTPVCCDIIFY